MEKCGILDALKYVEDLHKQIPSKDWKSKNVVGELFNRFNKDRVDLQRAAGFAGAKPLTIYKADDTAGPTSEPIDDSFSDNGRTEVETNKTPLENIDNGELNAIIESYSKKCEG